MAASSQDSSSPVEEKAGGSQVDAVHTNELVPGHPAYYEKDGLRTYGDDEDHDHEPRVRCSLYNSIGQPLIIGLDVFQKSHVPDCYGIPLDRLPNPRLHFWYGQFKTI